MNMQTLNYDIKNAATELGSELATWRKLLGLTSAQVANRANIARSTYSKIENGAFGEGAMGLLSVLRSLGLLDKLLDAMDPYNSDLGRVRADQQLPQRVRHKTDMQ
jgi:transcriptional regulator with XRE-family HTH domain